MDMPDKVATDMKQRLAELRAPASALGEHRRTTLAEMRQSMEAIRQLGEKHGTRCGSDRGAAGRTDRGEGRGLGRQVPSKDEKGGTLVIQKPASPPC